MAWARRTRHRAGLAPVISPSTNYEQQPDGSYPQGRVYTRADNPTSEYAERLLAALEGGGCACALFSSGMASATAVFQSLLPGDHVLVSRVLHWGDRDSRRPGTVGIEHARLAEPRPAPLAGRSRADDQ
jgi:cystathionine beta-lyase/cystathionine gamma-synthase